ncbi:hypothetical protein GLOIN_2v1668453 [Rhizophagus irregularis DAOM 181602=DAOM 197198]|nr:hypothetical protein GLOIN_2v1668453 [Rhizophagus irregularis DAOM 181602=DAOM 197198]
MSLIDFFFKIFMLKIRAACTIVITPFPSFRLIFRPINMLVIFVGAFYYYFVSFFFFIFSFSFYIPHSTPINC